MPEIGVVEARALASLSCLSFLFSVLSESSDRYDARSFLNSGKLNIYIFPQDFERD